MTTRFENLDSGTQDTIDKALTSINSIWNTWFPDAGNETTTTTGGGGGTTSPGGPGGTTTHQYNPPPPAPTKSYKGLIYAGVGLGVLGVGFLIYKAVKKKG
jgi:hypothetical protein